jgi:cytochrome P450
MTHQRAPESADYDDLFRMETLAAYGGAVDDPYPAFAELLARGPVHHGTLSACIGLPPEHTPGYFIPGMDYYSVFSFAAVSDAFLRKDDFVNDAYIDIGIAQEFGDTILTMNGLRHRRYRNIIQEYFQPAAAETWWHHHVIAGVIDDLIAKFEHADCVDLNAALFGPLPLRAITKGFGMSLEDGIAFRREMLKRLHTSSPEGRLSSKVAAGRILEKVILERQQRPQDDLISKLAHADLKEEDGSVRKLTVEEVASLCRLIVFAGGETTWRQMGIALYALLNHPDQLDAAIRDRSLLHNAILESTRLYADPMFPRKVSRDTVLHGVALPAGAHLHLCLGAANRDPSRWDQPNDFDIHRPVQRSVAFGAGVHSCLGQHVARQEISAALNALFDRFPNIRWDPAKPAPRMIGNLSQRGPDALHVLLR